MTTEGDAAREAVRQQLVALRADADARAAARLLRHVCGGCGMTVLEVFSTRPFRALCTRTIERDHRGGRWSEPTGHLSPDRVFVLMPDDRAGRPDPTPIGAPCKCEQRMLTWGTVWDDLRDGVTRRVLPTDADHDAE